MPLNIGDCQFEIELSICALCSPSPSQMYPLSVAVNKAFQFSVVLGFGVGVFFPEKLCIKSLAESGIFLKAMSSAFPPLSANYFL